MKILSLTKKNNANKRNSTNENIIFNQKHRANKRNRGIPRCYLLSLHSSQIDCFVGTLSSNGMNAKGCNETQILKVIRPFFF